MKVNFLALFLLISLPSIYADTYLKDTTTWTEYSVLAYLNPPAVTNKSQFIVLGDTVIAEKSYKKLFYNLAYFGALRESGKKIYAFLENNPFSNEKSETLLYDFGAEKGDSIKFGHEQFYDVLVESVDSVTLDNGDRRKEMRLSSGDIWIEGIGSLNGLLNPVTPVPTCMWISMLVCYKQVDTVLYSNTEYCFGDCCTFKGSSQAIRKVEKFEFNVLLDKANKILELHLPDNSEIIETVCLINSNGVVVKVEQLNSSGKICVDVSALTSGVYIVQIKTKDKIFNQKIAI